MSSLREKANKSKDYKLWNELADTYFDIGIFKEASIAYSYSLELNPKQTYKKIILAICYGNMNKYEKASKTLKSILEEQNNNFYANYYYAKLLKNEFEDRRWLKYMKQARKLVDTKMAMFNSEEEREYIKEDIESELQN
jgi:tetratricopeptide (TPR) repeat protein